jgi:hypothetical protein
MSGVIRSLENLEGDRRQKHPFHPGVAVYLHDQIATAEELERMLRDTTIYTLTEEELADEG